MRINTVKLRTKMFEKALRQKDLAERTGLSYSVINGICCGRACGDDTAAKIAAALNVRLEELEEGK